MWWESFTFREGQWYCWRLAGSEICIRREGKTWQSYYRHLRWEERNAACIGPIEEEPGFKENYQTDIINRKTAALRPCLPEKPFLLNLGGLKLFPGNRLTLNLKLPPLLNLIAEKSKGPHDHIFGFSPFELKEAWYGKNTMEGILCSSLPINVSGKTGDETPPADNDGSCCLDIHCILYIRNQAKTILNLDKIRFFTAELNIYEKDGKLISDTAQINALENDFRMTVVSVKQECDSVLAHGYKQDPWHTHQRTQIIKNLTGL